MAFSGLDRRQRLNILDLGSAESESIDFYNHFLAQICIADLVNERDPGQGWQIDQELPDQARGMHFDVCLLWDCPNFLDKHSLREFGQDLASRFHANTRVHAIAAYTSAWAFEAYRYSMLDYDRIVIKPRSGNVPHPHSQTDIEKALPGFRIQRVVLRPGNRLELLLLSR